MLEADSMDGRLQSESGKMRRRAVDGCVSFQPVWEFWGMFTGCADE